MCVGISLLPKPRHDQLDGLFRLNQIRITLTNVTFRNAMCAEKDVRFIGTTGLIQLALYGQCKRFDIDRMIKPLPNPLNVDRLELRACRNEPLEHRESGSRRGRRELREERKDYKSLDSAGYDVVNGFFQKRRCGAHAYKRL